MGTVSSKDTRRISFENSFTMSTALAAKTLTLEDDNALDQDAMVVTVEKGKDYRCKDNEKTNLQEAGGEMEYWTGRLDHLKKQHREINKVIETEYKKTLETSNKILEKPSLTEETILKLRPCYDHRKKILECYEENAHQPLVCSSVVQAFTNCVRSFQEETATLT